MNDQARQVLCGIVRKYGRGVRDKEFFKLKIYAIHETKYALVG